MKLLHYVLGASVLIFGSDLIFITKISSLNACPRCRRALPKGPRKHSHQGFASRHEKPAVAKVVAERLSDSCAGSCCCAQQKNPTVRLSHNKNEETINE